jgi:hypothetical protein
MCDLCNHSAKFMHTTPETCALNFAHLMFYEVSIF